MNKNIVCGNALNLKCVDENANDTNEPIVFSEWTFPFNDSRIQRKDYTFSELLEENTDDLQLTMETEDKSKFIEQYICVYKQLGI